MNEYSEQRRPELTIIGENPDPQSPQNPAADFLALAYDEAGNQELQFALGQPGMPEAAEKVYRAYAEDREIPAPLRAAAAIGKLLVSSNAGSRLDPDPETWGYIAQDEQFSTDRNSFVRLTHNNESFYELRYKMTGRILAIFCLRAEKYRKRSEQDQPPLKNTA